MTRLTLAARNLLVQDDTLLPLIGSGTLLGPWVFADSPFARIENSQKVLVVITENGSHSPANLHNTVRFPKMYVDVWADPTRNSDNSVHAFDADDKIEAVLAVINKHFHTANLDVPPGAPAYQGAPGSFKVWGTAEQIAARTGVLILGSQFMDGPTYSDVSNSTGTRMGRVWYAVDTI